MMSITQNFTKSLYILATRLHETERFGHLIKQSRAISLERVLFQTLKKEE
jgi:hypothetical protein